MVSNINLRTPTPRGESLKLGLVQLLTRHGDRTSINPLPSEREADWKSLLISDEQRDALAARAAPAIDELVFRDSVHGRGRAVQVERIRLTLG